MGHFDCDPASTEAANATVRASKFYSANGEHELWNGKVWCNPPGGRNSEYGSSAGAFLSAAVNKFSAGEFDEGVLLLRAAIGSAWFAPVFQLPHAFLKRRPQFTAPGSSNRVTVAPSPHGYVLVYFGARVREFESSVSSIAWVPGHNSYPGDEYNAMLNI